MGPGRPLGHGGRWRYPAAAAKRGAFTIARHLWLAVERGAAASGGGYRLGLSPYPYHSLQKRASRGPAARTHCRTRPQPVCPRRTAEPRSRRAVLDRVRAVSAALGWCPLSHRVLALADHRRTTEGPRSPRLAPCVRPASDRRRAVLQRSG